MEQKTTLSKSIDTTEQKAQYDAACKKVLAEKIILAWIMKHTMKEYVNYDVREIVERFIVGEPKVAKTRVLPDETNAPKIAGTGVEDSTVTEGTITYDIQFRAIVPVTDEVVQMIINVEAQNDFYPGYPIIKRGIYYCARMISSQYGIVFTNSHYEKIQKVYSVWICMNPPKERNNTIAKYAIQEEDVFGEIQEKEILESEFRIPMTEKMEEEVEHMCNLSDGVEQKGIQKGIEIGIEQGIEQELIRMITRKLEKNKSVEQIADELEIEVNEVERYIGLIESR